ncbi:Dyp-type peroxidase [Streptomyces sp. NPDC056909]|uniref:Dyp-type peroxidase n=1 Tax=Streptomyces sp. NPDC056909 TaxID=3345963 RepID=UPI0036C76600
MQRRTLLLFSSAAALAGGSCTVCLLRRRREPPRAMVFNSLPDQLRFPRAPGRVAMMALDRELRASEAAGQLRQLARGIGLARTGGVSAALALGSSVFTRHDRRPSGLVEMPIFAGDLLDPGQSHGDVLVQVAGERADQVRKTVERLQAAVPGWRVRWRIDGFRAENRVEGGRGLARNPFHFTEGFGNPASEREMAERALVRAGQGEPDWAVGGSYQVVRIIRFATELWDKDSVHEQERIIGRRRDGRWLDGAPRDEEPNFAADPKGRLTPLNAHVRLAAPDRRNPPPLVRRSYTYDRGNGDTGLIFSCFQRDLVRGFEAVQKRLEGEAMAKYILTTGGGYFFVPPPGDAWIDAVASAR